MNKQTNNLQDIFLNSARKNKILITVYLVNGFHLKGYVKGFDNFTVVLESDNKQMLLYKHSITTITPNKNILFANE